MLQLASKVPQALCQCSRCFGSCSRPAVAKRMGNGNVTQRMVTPSATFFYSAMFAAAAVADAKTKDDRRKKWDAAIAKAREGLDEEDPGHKLLEDKIDLLDGTAEFCRLAECAQKEERLWSQIVPRMDDDITLLPRTGNSNKTHLSQRVGNDVWDDKKLKRITLSTERLIILMLLSSRVYGLKGEALTAVPESLQTLVRLGKDELKSKAGSLKERIWQLAVSAADEYDSIPSEGLVHYAQSSEGPFHWAQHKARRELNERILAIFENAKDQPWSLRNSRTIPELAASLTTATVSPNTETYNILLAGLARMNYRSCFMSTLRSMIQEGRVRPNKHTYRTVLAYYRIRSHQEPFDEFVARMRGEHGGLMLARPNIQVTAAGKGRFVPQPESDKVIQKPYPDSPTFDELIMGTLQFHGVVAAARLIRDMSSEGWRLTMRGLTQCLKFSAHNCHWEFGAAVWQQILKLPWRNEFVTTSMPPLPASTLYWMLKLCACCGKDEAFRELYMEACAAGLLDPNPPGPELLAEESLPSSRRVRLDSKPDAPAQKIVPPSKDKSPASERSTKERRRYQHIKMYARDPAPGQKNTAHSKDKSLASKQFTKERRRNQHEKIYQRVPAQKTTPSSEDQSLTSERSTEERCGIKYRMTYPPDPAPNEIHPLGRASGELVNEDADFFAKDVCPTLFRIRTRWHPDHADELISSLNSSPAEPPQKPKSSREFLPLWNTPRSEPTFQATAPELSSLVKDAATIKPEPHTAKHLGSSPPATFSSLDKGVLRSPDRQQKKATGGPHDGTKPMVYDSWSKSLLPRLRHLKAEEARPSESRVMAIAPNATEPLQPSESLSRTTPSTDTMNIKARATIKPNATPQLRKTGMNDQTSSSSWINYDHEIAALPDLDHAPTPQVRLRVKQYGYLAPDTPPQMERELRMSARG